MEVTCGQAGTESIFLPCGSQQKRGALVQLSELQPHSVVRSPSSREDNVKPGHYLLPLLLALLIVACGVAPTVTPVPQRVEVATPFPTSTVAPAATSMPTPLSSPQITEPAPSPTPEIVMPTKIQVEPTFTPVAGETRVDVSDLPLGEPGHYANLVYGYRFEYPASWYAHFGNRPVLVSLSNLDPGRHNRDAMRDTGCLFEVNASLNIYGFSLNEIRAQMPRVFSDAAVFHLDGAMALRIKHQGGEELFDGDWIYVENDGRLFFISAEYSREAAALCGTAWEELLTSWDWFAPEFAVYRNTEYGYAISAPRDWYRLRTSGEGIWLSDQLFAEDTEAADIMRAGMLVVTDVLDNDEGLTIKEHLQNVEEPTLLSNDIVLGNLVGVRVLRKGPELGIAEVSGYFEGPLGTIYEVSCYYPEDRQEEFESVANAILYSFSF